MSSAVLLALLVACEPAAEDAALPAAGLAEVDVEAEAERIRELSAQWSSEASDPAAFSGYFASDGVLMAPNAPAAEGPEAIRQWSEEVSGLEGFSVSWTPAEIEVARTGDLAYERGTYQLSFQGPEGPVEDQGKYLTTWKKVNGEWKVAADIFNTDLPLPGEG